MKPVFCGIVLGMGVMVLTLGAAPAFAAADGALGAISTATSNVSLSIPEQFRISGVSDLDLGSFTGSGDLSASADVCVYSNGDGGYQVSIVDNSSGGGGFRLENQDHTAGIAINVSWNDALGVSGAVPVAYGSPMPMSSANTASADCSSGGKSANLSVSVANADMIAAPPGAYESTLTIMVEPD